MGHSGNRSGHTENTKFLLGGSAPSFLPTATTGDILVETFDMLFQEVTTYQTVIKDLHEVGFCFVFFSWSQFRLKFLDFFMSLTHVSLPVSPLLTTFTVPSVYPQNVTVQLNESRLLIKWKPPPDDKINGILRGYDVIVRHGAHHNKVSLSVAE